MTSARTRDRLLDRLREQGIRDEVVLERIRQSVVPGWDPPLPGGGG